MQTANRLFKLIPAALMVVLGIAACKTTSSSDIEVNDLDYFETRGVNVLVFNNPFSGGFNDEKDSGIELIHHGVRTAQGGAIRLSNTPEQWDLVPDMTSKTVNKEDNSIEVGLRFPDFDFDSRIVVTGKGKAVEIAVYLDKPVPEELVGDAGLNLEFQPAEYWLKTFIMDGKPNRFPRYAVSNTITRPNSEKIKQYKGYKTYDDRGTDRFVDPLPLATGHEMLLAPEEPERTVKITCDDADAEKRAADYLAQNVKKAVVKSKSAQKGNIELSYEVNLKSDDTGFMTALSEMEGVNSAVLVSYNGDYMG